MTNSTMEVSKKSILEAIKYFELSHKPLCIHSSFRSFGGVEGGPSTVINSFLEEGFTLLVPTFSYSFSANPPDGNPYSQNAFWVDPSSNPNPMAFSPNTQDIDPDMGIIPKFIVNNQRRMRGRHPLDSFSAIGPLASELIAGQDAMNIYAPLNKLLSLDGFIVLMGVGLDKLTFVHLAEQMAGRNLFRRWAWGENHKIVETQVGGCSDGFVHLEKFVSPLMRTKKIGMSTWKVLPAKSTLDALVKAIRENPNITHCENPQCGRCNDAVMGGPILSGNKNS